MHDSETISCPRCGYDLSGTHTPGAAEGLCSECGLQFKWEDVISGRLHVPRFSYEHGSAFSVPRLGTTIVLAILGWPLWRRLSMVHDIVPRRLLTFALLAALGLHLSTVTLVIYAVATNRSGGWVPGSLTAAMARWKPGGPLPAPVPVPGTAFTISSFGTGMWPVTWGDLAQLCVWPYGTIVWINAPIFGSTAIISDATGILGCTIVQLGTPAVFLMLRQTRRQFRLRKVHLLRGLCLVTPLIGPVFVLSQLSVQGMWLGRTPSNGPGSIDGILIAIEAISTCAVASTLWWWSFAKLYLKAPHSLGIAAAGVILGTIVGLLIGLVFNVRVLYDQLG